MVDHQTGVTILESCAILAYLSSKTGCLWPVHQREQSTIQQWLYFQTGSVGPMLGQLWWFLNVSEVANEEVISRYRRETLRLYGVVNRRLGESTLLEYAIAHGAAFTWLRTFGELDVDVSEFPHADRWLKVIGACPTAIQGRAASGAVSRITDGRVSVAEK